MNAWDFTIIGLVTYDQKHDDYSQSKSIKFVESYFIKPEDIKSVSKYRMIKDKIYVTEVKTT